MFLKNLALLNFKNYDEVNVEFTQGVNFFTGNNGEGKTNLLDAIHYLSLCKSYFNAIDSLNIKREKAFLMIQGDFDKNDKVESISCGIKRGQKKQFKKNKKEYSRLAEHIGQFPSVMISPSDISLILGGSEIRRKFVDSVICQYSKSYLDNLISYNRVLSQRNALLKYFAKGARFDSTSLDVWDAQLVPLGEKIHKERSTFLTEFVARFQEHYDFISGEKESVELIYESQLIDGSFAELLKGSVQKDRALNYTTVGVHKDDLIFQLNDFPIKKFGSQGQQKSYLIALKLAQFEFIHGIKKVKPLLLLDDVFDKLDGNRVKKIMELISQDHFGQIFITDTNQERLFSIFDDIEIGQKYFEIDNGAVVNEEVK
jgi:DNA replication and repair protein RecF